MKFQQFFRISYKHLLTVFLGSIVLKCGTKVRFTLENGTDLLVIT